MAKQLFSNNASAFLAAGIGTGVTSVTVATGKGALFSSPTGTNFEMLTIYDGAAFEIVKLTSRAGDTLTVTRAQEGTSAQTWTTTARIEGRVTKASLEKVIQNESEGTTSMALGDSPISNGIDGLAIGNGAHAGDITHLYDIAIGKSSKATFGAGVAIGYMSVASAPSVRANTTLYSYGDMVQRSAQDGYVFFCIQGGTTGGAEPTMTNSWGAQITDGTAIWWSMGGPTGYNDSVAIGDSAKAFAQNSVSIGRNALSASYSFAGGYGARAISYGVAIGNSAAAINDSSVAIGASSTVEPSVGGSTGWGAVAIGFQATVSGSLTYATAIGSKAINRIGKSHNITGPSLIRKDLGDGESIIYHAGSESIIFSAEVNLKTVADGVDSIAIPAGATFYPNEIGVVVTSASGVTGQPQVSAGITGDTTALLAQTATTKSAAKGRDVFSPVSKDGVTSLTASVKVAATGTTMLGRFYWKGMLVEDQ